MASHVPTSVQPSYHWKRNHPWNEFIQENPKFASINRDQIPLLAANLRPGRSCVLSSKFTYGTSNVVFEIAFDDGVVWICRVHQSDHPNYVKMIIESTVATMRYVQRNTTIPVPTIHAYESDSTATKISSAFIFMDGISGVHARMRDIPNPQKYFQMADVAMQLAGLRFPKIGRIYQMSTGDFTVGPFVKRDGMEYGPFSTAVEYYTFLAESDARERCSRKYEGPDHKAQRTRDRFASHLYCTAATRLSLANAGPFAIIHGDFGVHNILFAPDDQMTGVVDWEHSQTAPALLSCDYPGMLAVRWPYVDRHNPVVFKTIPKCQELFHEGIRLSEQKYKSVAFEGKLMSDIVGSPPAIVSQILENLNADIGYRKYDGWKVFEFLYGETNFDTARIELGESDDDQW